jgi:hypothetical protein
MGAASEAARLALKKQRKKHQRQHPEESAKRRAAAIAAKLAREKAAAQAAAALKAQQEAAAALISESASWRIDMEVENVLTWRLKTCLERLELSNTSNRTVSLRLPACLPAAVQHVVNPVLQTAYEREKEELSARLGGAANDNEQFLFHGTSLASSEAIIRDNFCLSKVRNTITTPLLCQCSLSSKVSCFILSTHRRAYVWMRPLAARWEPGRAAILEEASISPTVCI